VYFVASNSDFLERWEQTYYEGSLEGREDIFSAAAEMISERPLLGWQPVNWFYELGQRVGGEWTWRGRDVHNLYLAVLLEVGVLGATPFFIGLWWCARSAWRARRERLGLLPLALLVTLLAGSMAGTSLYYKVPWLILALTLSAGPAAMPSELKKQFPVRLSLSRESIKRIR